ncbi:MAG: cystathionine gamma-synthase family protein [Flavobacteriales bacterium]|nr:cystathionine gamma-synthase family protein [Flavobacteriales bacterium]MCB9181155.1 cystathionine gamma-synthase family protein [Flavobacteriales bacterium]MCB9199466.1 cystathionine gamma-synthase family protein [Flavobacteriales bacterium]HOP43859.1 cystathionine gamma-synthase family protein [Flavobacteriales bacterium]HPF67564.1 cystathionine gamma-synthase family protein [Flavobacteriales bacterium]
MASSDHPFRPESLMMSHGYKPELSEGAIKCPIFQTSTFVFRTAEEGKAFFEVAYGIREKGEKEELGLIYSRLNNPDLQILEERLCLWDGAEECAVFESGMSAISTTLLEFLSPGDVLLFSNPVYGGTDHFIKGVLTRFGIEVMGFYPWEQEELAERVKASGKAERVKMIYIETPANPTNTLIDIRACAALAQALSTDERRVLLAVDNTYMGPLWQHPLKLGADLVLYSATKYIGGHSDVIAGACLGSRELIARVKELRTFLGCMAGPWTGWLLLRSLETLKPRMETQARNAALVAQFLEAHPKVTKLYYQGLIDDPAQERIFQAQCESPGAMLSFRVQGGEAGAFRFLNELDLVKLAVSLGSTESLAEHPATMTHAGVDPVEREKLGISEDLVRLSVGVEHPDDLIWDLEQALKAV